jgi:hypothetical protein
MTPVEFEFRLRELLRSQSAGPANSRCIDCHGCERCVLSTFCGDSQRLLRCHYCDDCSDSTDCSHCRGCKGCLGCSHCIACERCTEGSHLVRSIGLSGCSYCFGCVGLSNKDFHILNEPYDRSTYFAMTKALSKAMAI